MTKWLITNEELYSKYIKNLSNARKEIEREAKDAGFSSLPEYLMFLQIYETYKTERGDYLYQAPTSLSYTSRVHMWWLDKECNDSNS